MKRRSQNLRGGGGSISLEAGPDPRRRSQVWGRVHGLGRLERKENRRRKWNQNLGGGTEEVGIRLPMWPRWP